MASHTELMRKRLRIVAGIIILCSLVLVGKLYMVQIVQNDAYTEEANRQYARPLGNIFDRGSVFFTDKNDNLISGATIKTGFIVAINPTLITDSQSVFEDLSAHIEMDSDDFFRKASKTTDPYEEVARRVPEEVANAIIESDIDGVSVIKEKWRYYPGERLASHLLGFVGFAGDERSGRYGLEKQYEGVLRRGGDELYINFFAEVFSGIAGSIEKKKLSREGSVVTTIEPTVQAFLETELVDISNTWSSRQSMGIIINPKTGALYALAVNPSFNPNTFQEEDSISIFSNPLVERVYEMGSIIKPLTMAAGLDAGAVTAETTYNDEGFLIVDTARISNYDGKGRGVVNMQEVLNQSLNTGVSFVVDRLGTDSFSEYFKSFGMGSLTGIDLPGEVGGLISNLDSPRRVEYMTASFGQGIALSPINTVRALSVLGNGGYLVQPYVVDHIDYTIGFSKNTDREEPVQVLKEETSDEITRMLVKVVDDALLDGAVSLPNYSIAAKTGTAQIASPNGGYYDDRYLHSFFGYFPAYNPEFLVFLMTIEPVGVRYASQTLTRPFFDIAKFLINYYEIAPDREVLVVE